MKVVPMGKQEATRLDSDCIRCICIGTTLSKTKCVRSRNGRSLQHPKQISAPAIVKGTRRTIVVLYLHVQCSQLHCVRTFHRCSRVFAVLIVANATAWAMYVYMKITVSGKIMLSGAFKTEVHKA